MSKLYTEEQVTKLTSAAYLAGQNHNTFIFGVEFENITPIELPTDDEIEMAAPYVPIDAHDYYVGDRDGFIEGAKWMRDKIKGGNK